MRHPCSPVASALRELRRRHVFRVAILYVVVGVGILEAAESVFPRLGLEDWTVQLVLGLLIVGLPLALFLAWAYELTPEGIVRTEPRVETPVERLPHAAPAARTGTAVSGGRTSILVLPFDNMSPEPSDAYFSDGLTEEIITHLSQLRSLRVISRSSAMALKGTNKDVRTIGEELGVQYVLEGSVRKAGDALRITAQLIDADADDHLWAERYDGTLEEVFEMQERTSRAIVEALDLELHPGESEKLLERPIGDARAYECYLSARIGIHTATAESLERALQQLEIGLDILGENALLYQGMAEAHLMALEAGVKPKEEALQEAADLAAQVFELAPDSADSHYLKGRLERFRGSASRAATDFARAVAIDPGHLGALYFLMSACTLQIGRAEAVEELARRVEEIDPLSPLTRLGIGWHDWLTGRLDRARQTFHRTADLAPGFLWPLLFDAYVLTWQGRPGEALRALEPLTRRDPPDLFSDWAVLLRWALSGDADGARAALSGASRDYFWNDPEFPWFIASAYALADAHDEALAWLERAVEHGWINYPLFAERDPLLDGVRGDERFRALIARVKVEWEEFELPAELWAGAQG